MIQLLLNKTTPHFQLLPKSKVDQSYSPAAIIRNAKILLYYFITCIFPNIKLKSGFRISCSVRRKLFEESTTTALTPNLLGILTFLGFLKSVGGDLNGVTAM